MKAANQLGRLFNYCYRSFLQRWLGNLIRVAKWWLLKFYRLYLWLKRQIKTWELKTRQGWLRVVAHHNFFTLIFLAIIILVVIHSLINTNRALAQNFGQQSLIIQLLGENEELVEESTAATPTNQIEKAPLTESITPEEEPEELPSETLLPGSLALVKPELISPEELKRTKIQKYIIQKGDTLSFIAQRFQISVPTLRWANNLTAYATLRTGTTLVVPPTSGVIHNVRKGDTLASIAKKYGADKNKIADYNHVTDGSLVVGDILIIPEGKIIPVAPPKTTAPAAAPNYAAYQIVGTGDMVWPTTCRRITQYFRGYRHTGIDIGCGRGVPIYAADDGIVVQVIYSRIGYGYHLIIDHGNGKYTLYGHASAIYVEAGQNVARGQMIAAMGSTGRSTGPHLHFEVRLSGPRGTRVNPLSYVR